ncbi:MAG: 7-cyano-7-deazaguanine synthase QueC [Candidatus Cloacimonetes bacterium HGW-Cloacimonetes-2]|jgi:7-cyano-7-deazaguanine synthase|nr:MAG: 7-cyano-7-deazaguanine synthase QueC [Candidatus Cloacimonetes bacterium HGW-Cloacimonetes-2]
MRRAVVLVSGGMDSLVAAAIAVKECEEVNFLHIDYGQTTMSKEAECFEAMCVHYMPKRSKTIKMMWLSEIGGSALTDESMQIEDHSELNEIPNTYVPFRNANLIGAAVSWAEVINASRVYIGAVEEDSSGYPDCREDFFRALQLAIGKGTKTPNPIMISTPVLHMSKAQIVKKGLELGAPFQHSWSCYRDNQIACGTCDSCYLRLKAFREAGIHDPIPYKNQGI